MTFGDDDKPNNEKSKALVPHKGVPAVRPPPKPKNFILEFNELVAATDAQCRDVVALQREWEKRNYPVRELVKDFETDQYSWALTISHSATSLLEKLQALWPDENIHYHASRMCIGLRLGKMREDLPKGDGANANNLIDRVEAELPSVMVLESTCRELTDNKKQFPQAPADILPVLREQKRIWARRMEALDVERIVDFGNEWQEARQEQHAIFEEALRQRLAFANRTELLALLDVDRDKRVDGYVHYVAAIANLFQENCTELAEKLRHCLETYQRLVMKILNTKCGGRPVMNWGRPMPKRGVY